MKNGQKTNKWGVNFHFGVEIKADKGVLIYNEN